MRHLKAGGSEQTTEIGRWRRTEEEASHNSALTAAQAGAIAVKDWGAIPTVHTRGAETAVGSGWLARIEAGPRVRGREVV